MQSRDSEWGWWLSFKLLAPQIQAWNFVLPPLTLPPHVVHTRNPKPRKVAWPT